MKKINRNFAKKEFGDKLLETVDGFEGMKFDEVINNKAKFFCNENVVFSYVEEKNYIFDLLICTINGKVSLIEIDRFFSEIGKDIYVEFKNKRFFKVILHRYKKRAFKINDSEAVLLFRKECD